MMMRRNWNAAGGSSVVLCGTIASLLIFGTLNENAVAFGALVELHSDVIVCSSNPDFYIPLLSEAFVQKGLAAYTVWDGRQQSAPSGTHYYIGRPEGFAGNECVSRVSSWSVQVEEAEDLPSFRNIPGKLLQGSTPYTYTFVGQAEGKVPWIVSYCYTTEERCGLLLPNDLSDLMVRD